MLDLKAKLASAGLVSAEDIERVEQEKAKRRSAQKAASPGQPRGPDTAGLPLRQLLELGKAERYTAVRKWVDKVRLDVPGAVPTEAARNFHFPASSGKVGRLVLEPEVTKALEQGEAAVIAYMSNHGLAHAVVPAAGARAVAELFPLWLRVLAGDERAGKLEKDG